MYFLIRGEEEKNWKFAFYAGLCVLVLGNIHSYDILHIAAAWGLYLIIGNIVSGKFDAASWGRGLLAGAMAVPTAAYQLYLFKVDPIFHARVEVATVSQGLQTYILGYGLALFFAIAAVVMLARSEAFRAVWRTEKAPLVFVCWALGAFLLAYAPCSFQRKMIMGTDIPLCLLAGAAAAFAGEWFATKQKQIGAGFLPLLLCVASLPSGMVWISYQLKHIASDSSETFSPPFLKSDDLALYDWINQSTPKNSAFVGHPDYMLFIPGLCDRAVWCGHWGETPNYGEKRKQIGRLYKGIVANPKSMIEGTKAQYLVWTNEYGQISPNITYLQMVYSNKTWTVYKIL
jgi:hypothetical protein